MSLISFQMNRGIAEVTRSTVKADIQRATHCSDNHTRAVQYSPALGTCKVVVGTYAQKAARLLTDALIAATWRQVHRFVKPLFHTSTSNMHTSTQATLFTLPFKYSYTHTVAQVSSLLPHCIGWKSASAEVCVALWSPHTLRGSMPGGDTALDDDTEVRELGSSPLTVLQLDMRYVSKYGHT